MGQGDVLSAVGWEGQHNAKVRYMFSGTGGPYGLLACLIQSRDLVKVRMLYTYEGQVLSTIYIELLWLCAFYYYGLNHCKDYSYKVWTDTIKEKTKPAKPKAKNGLSKICLDVTKNVKVKLAFD